MRKPYGTSIFCDDIRYEVGNKHSFMGIYSGDMNIEAVPPFTLPKLAIAVRMYIPTPMVPNDLRVVVFKHVGESVEELLVAEGTIPQERPGGSTNRDPEETYVVANINLTASPFHVEKSCVLKVRGFIADQEVRLGTIRVNFVQAQGDTSSDTNEANSATTGEASTS